MDSGNMESRNWAELPQDVITVIFQKLGVVDLLLRAQLVCSAWRKCSKEPKLYRCIYTEKWEESFPFGDYVRMEKLVREAIKRSRGECIEITIDSFATDAFVKYMAKKLGSLRRLLLVYSGVVKCEALLEMVRKLPQLEELGFAYSFITKELLEAVASSCPRLKTFQLNYTTFVDAKKFDAKKFDEGAQAIAKSLPELHHLNLFGSRLTDDGVRAILDGCTQLQSLDLRRCCHVSLAGDLKKRCAERNIKLLLPKDPTGDFIHEIYSSSEDEDENGGAFYYEQNEGAYYADYEQNFYAPNYWGGEDADPYGLL